MNAKMELSEGKEMLLQADSQQMQLVQALSSLGERPDLMIGTDVSKVLQGINKAQEQLKNASSELKARLTEHANKAWYNIIDDTESRLRDAELNNTRAITELSSRSTELLLFNTAISKVICDMQGVLLQQQGTLDQQTQGLEKQNEAVLANTEVLKELYARRTEEESRQDAFASQVTQVMVALDKSQEEAHAHVTRQLQKLEHEFESRIAAQAKVQADRERTMTEQMRQDAATRIEAVAMQLADSQMKARAMGRLVKTQTIGLGISIALGIGALASHLMLY